MVRGLLGGLLVLVVVAAACGAGPAMTATPPAAGAPRGAVLYVATDDGAITAYQIGTWRRIGRWTGLPIRDGVRGVASYRSSLFVAHGRDRSRGPGGLLRWDMVTHRVIYNRRYAFGIDQPAVCRRPSGVRVVLPGGELTGTTAWRTVRVSDGAVTGALRGGLGPHNTICHSRDVLMGGRQARYLYQTAGPRVGPSPSAKLGVRPFTVDAANSLVYITWTAFRGFSVGSLHSGRILSTRRFGPVPAGFGPSAPSHGISLNPAGTRVYVLDTPLHRVLVYTTGAKPRLLAPIRIPDGLAGAESPCAYDCRRDGWLLNSLDGRFVFVGDSGDVISTLHRRVVAQLPALLQSRHGFLEIVWANGRPVASSTHFGVGR
jgi:hypothetical protein